jgi:2-polyprenyl-3-methyl-5-hydroxy-6-metoxy-1,4-benzoquinol methylase
VLSKQDKDAQDPPAGNNALEWEKRSINYGASLKSVLFKALPDPANEHLHSTHVNFILDCLGSPKDHVRILDVGCGYGRLSLPVISKFPRAEILGMDISPNYVDLYKKYTGRDALVGTLESLSLEAGTFDYIIIVTVLMYLPETKLQEVFSRLLSRLNPDGKIILIEPDKSGMIFQTAFGLSKLLQNSADSKNADTGGKCFSATAIRNLVNRAGGRIIKEQRIPATTFFFLLIYISAKFLPARCTKIFSRWLAVIDDLLKKNKLPTLWMFHLIEKK